MEPEVLLVEKADGIAVLTLNRPTSMNALSARLRHALVRELAALQDDDSVRVVILTGAGERAFSAGLDLNELTQQQGIMTSIVGAGTDDNLGDAFAAFGKPVVCAVNGLAITGGLELVLCCDIVIASSNAGFADTHAKVEAVPAWGLSQRLSRTVGVMRAKEMSLTGKRIDAQTALAWGLVNHVVEPEALMPLALELAGAMAGLVPQMVADYKQLIDDGIGMTLAEGLALESSTARARAAAFSPAIKVGKSG